MSRTYSLKRAVRVGAEALKQYSLDQETARAQNQLVVLLGFYPQPSKIQSALEMGGRLLREYERYSRKVANDENMDRYKSM